MDNKYTVNKPVRKNMHQMAKSVTGKSSKREGHVECAVITSIIIL